MGKETKAPETEAEVQQDIPEEEAQAEQKEQDKEKTEDGQKEEKKPKKKEPKKDKKAEEIKRLTEELASQKEKYLRLAAEYDNYRKRTANEKLSIYSDATAKAVEELLPVADSVQIALQNMKDASDDERKGLELINQQLEKSFEKLNIESFGEVGEEFDPQLHNAIARIEDESLGKNQISAVYQKGFKIGDKLIRHAMVQVANCD